MGLGRQRSVATPPPFRTLNAERLPFNSLRDLTVVKRSGVLNGILQGATLTPLHDAPQTHSPAPVTGKKTIKHIVFP